MPGTGRPMEVRECLRLVSRLFRATWRPGTVSLGACATHGIGQLQTVKARRGSSKELPRNLETQGEGARTGCCLRAATASYSPLLLRMAHADRAVWACRSPIQTTACARNTRMKIISRNFIFLSYAI